MSLLICFVTLSFVDTATFTTKPVRHTWTTSSVGCRCIPGRSSTWWRREHPSTKLRGTEPINSTLCCFPGGFCRPFAKLSDKLKKNKKKTLIYNWTTIKRVKSVKPAEIYTPVPAVPLLNIALRHLRMCFVLVLRLGNCLIIKETEFCTSNFTVKLNFKTLTI